VKLYQGTRSGHYGTAIIVVDGGLEYPLPFVDKWQHERDHRGTSIPQATRADQRTFEWGYLGAGPADTAASILADHFGRPQPIRIVQRFKEDVVGRLGGPERGRWSLDGAMVDRWVAAHAELLTREWAAEDQDPPP
jgi:hypothetical protein